jgi:RNA exonuclease 4
MVGVGQGGTRSSLARCTVVNFHGEVVYDKYVAQSEKVVDWRTHVSGIEEHHVATGEDFAKVLSSI